MLKRVCILKCGQYCQIAVYKEVEPICFPTSHVQVGLFPHILTHEVSYQAF